MALKPDVTLSIVKNTKEPADGPMKLFYNENVYRVPKGGDVFREIPQTGLECIGELDAETVGSVLLLAAKSLHAVSPRSALALSDLDALTAVLDRISGPYTLREELLSCVSTRNAHGLPEACAKYGVDEKYAAPIAALLSLPDSPEEALEALRGSDDPALQASARALAPAVESLRAHDPSARILIDFSLVGDMNYYNGLYFKGYVDGVPEPVLQGGRYDRLMAKMGRKSGALGFALRLDLLERLDGEAQK
jgi:ATP phosphoribosyltransferase regulatory subunit